MVRQQSSSRRPSQLAGRTSAATTPGSSVTKSAPNAFEGVQAPGSTRPAQHPLDALHGGDRGEAVALRRFERRGDRAAGGVPHLAPEVDAGRSPASPPRGRSPCRSTQRRGEALDRPPAGEGEERREPLQRAGSSSAASPSRRGCSGCPSSGRRSRRRPRGWSSPSACRPRRRSRSRGRPRRPARGRSCRPCGSLRRAGGSRSSS